MHYDMSSSEETKYDNKHWCNSSIRYWIDDEHKAKEGNNNRYNKKVF